MNVLRYLGLCFCISFEVKLSDFKVFRQCSPFDWYGQRHQPSSLLGRTYVQPNVG